MKLKITATTASLTLQINGEVYLESKLLTGPPEVNDVISSNGKDALFSLDPGKYVYDFAIQSGQGTVKVAVTALPANVVLTSDTFDTKDGYFANDLAFEVK